MGKQTASQGPMLGPYAKKREVVFGIVERGGRVIAMQMHTGRYGYAMRHKIRQTVTPGSTVYTDEWRGYMGIERRYRHYKINHGWSVYVDGFVHTRQIEGFFSLVKNGIRGVYHHVSPKWLQGYLNEYAWRYNHRDDREAMFRTLLLRSTVS